MTLPEQVHALLFSRILYVFHIALAAHLLAGHGLWCGQRFVAMTPPVLPRMCPALVFPHQFLTVFDLTLTTCLQDKGPGAKRIGQDDATCACCTSSL
jgi:hypothetical protein